MITPIIQVIKLDGKFRRCEDFKVIIYEFLKVEKYPLSKIKDILATLEGGLYFTNVNLNQIYLQSTIDEEPQELIKINTPKSLCHTSG